MGAHTHHTMLRKIAQTSVSRHAQMRNALANGSMRNFAAASTADDAKCQPPLKLFGTAARYASALYTASAKKSALAAVETEIKQIVSLANSDKKFKEFMEDPTMARKKKLAGLDEFCKGGKFSETTSNFIKVVGENGRLSELEKSQSASRSCAWRREGK